ncbi:DUF4139 domain-containing protein [Gaetbulibacter aestuarii]|uniref:Mucoidy inhibitor MuiA family protein n=1 Tax=Gaetbulibacter aestuarii TaxID=1502358 RepID=A0ABW7MY43_9FLAO
MRILVLTLSLLLPVQIFSQNPKELSVTSKVDEVTVFLENAQITRNKQIQLDAGVTQVIFKDLSPFIIPSSVQTKVKGNITVLSVNYKADFVDKLEKPQRIIDLEATIENTQGSIDEITMENQVINQEIEFINANKRIGGNDGVSVTSLREAADFYRKRILDLNKSLLQNNKTLKALSEKISELNNEMNAETGVKEYSKGNVVIKIDSKMATKIDVALSYVVKNAGWLPFYDIKAKDINSPIALNYKANIHQDTKVDWKGVKLRLSTSNPNISGVTPELKTYYLNYGTPPPAYGSNVNQLSGVVMDEDGQPLPGATILVKGTTIGTSTDFDGKYNLTVPNGQGVLVFSYVGFNTVEKTIAAPIINVRMKESSEALDEVVVVGYGSTNSSNKIDRALRGKVSGVAIRGQGSSPQEPENISLPVEQVARQTTVEFEIDRPFTVPSDNKTYAVDVAQYEVPADYKYVSVPKVEASAFLTASINDWEKYNLLEGEANLFFENTFVGKSVLDVRYATDTLQLSLGRDKNISIKREQQTNFSSKKFIGTKKEEIRAWQITVKNNKQQTIPIEIHDQIPVSTRDEITVEVVDKSRGVVNPETGEVIWNLELKPADTKELDLKYAVKYPKYKRLLVE